MDKDKCWWRERLRMVRGGLRGEDVQRWSELIGRRVLEMECVREAGSVFVYVATAGEVQTRGLIAGLLGQGKVVGVPRIVGRGRMEARRIRSLEELVPGAYGIDTAPEGAELVEEPEVGLVPGLGFTESGVRLGRGAGFYDRYLGEHPEMVRVGLAFECQVVEELPVGEGDQRMDWVVTERRVICCGGWGVEKREKKGGGGELA